MERTTGDLIVDVEFSCCRELKSGWHPDIGLHKFGAPKAGTPDYQLIAAVFQKTPSLYTLTIRHLRIFGHFKKLEHLIISALHFCAGVPNVKVEHLERINQFHNPQ